MPEIARRIVNPSNARRITKLDPNNNDVMSSVGDDLLGDGFFRYSGTVAGIDGCVYGIPGRSKRILKCVYGIPGRSKRILKYDPNNDTNAFVGEEADKDFRCNRDGVLGRRDGCIYLLTNDEQVLKINTTNNSHGFVGNSIQLDHDDEKGWGDATLGMIDACMHLLATSCSYTHSEVRSSFESNLTCGQLLYIRGI